MGYRSAIISIHCPYDRLIFFLPDKPQQWEGKVKGMQCKNDPARSQWASCSVDFFHRLPHRKSISQDVTGVWFLKDPTESNWQLLTAECFGSELQNTKKLINMAFTNMLFTRVEANVTHRVTLFSMMLTLGFSTTLCFVHLEEYLEGLTLFASKCKPQCIILGFYALVQCKALYIGVR